MKYALSILIIIPVIFLIGCGPKKNPQAPTGKQELLSYIYNGSKLLREQKCQEAANEYTKYLAKDKSSPEAWNWLGVANLCLKDYSAAKVDFEKALSLDPMYSLVHNHLGILYMETEQWGLAEKEFNELLKDKRSNPAAAYYNLATLFIKKKDNQTALYYARKCVEYQPNEVAPRLLYISILTELNRIDEALAESRAIVQKNPKSQEANFTLANLLFDLSKMCEAKTYFSKVTEINPTNDIGKDALEKLRTIQCSQDAPLTPLP